MLGKTTAGVSAMAGSTEDGQSAPAETVSATPARTGAETKLWSTLLANPNSTTVALFSAAGIGRSTAGRILARWADEGHIQRTVEVGDDGQRGPDRWVRASATPSPVADESANAKPGREPVTWTVSAGT